MTRILIYCIIVGVCCASAEKTEFATTTELSKRFSTEDRLLANIAQAKNTTRLVPDKSDDEESKKTDKKPRTVTQRESGLASRDNCCGGTRYTSSAGSASRPDHNYNRLHLETGRYPSQYVNGERHPIDRYGWQSQARPPGTTGNGGRPGGGGGYGGGSYGGNTVYAGSQSGDRYGPRPGHGSESANRPSALGSGNVGGYGYGVSGYGYGRPTGYGGGSGGGYGISGTFADGDEFGPGEPAYPDGSMSYPGNIHAQKAVALKALAGVALIGAAAALASNPILLPIGVVAGRRKRSESFSDVEEVEKPDVQMDYILNTLKENLAKIQKFGSSDRLLISPRCVARLTCEIQKDYLRDVRNDVEILSKRRKQYFTNLIRRNVLSTPSVSANMRNLIGVAVNVAVEDKSCDVFTCNYIRKG